MKNVYFHSFALLLTAVSCWISGAEAVDPEMARARLEKLNSRPRRVIFNNDGCEVSSGILKTPSVENFLKLRHTGLLNKHVDVVSYCPVTTGFGNVSYQSRIFNDLTNHPKFADNLRWFYKNGTDPMMESIKFAHANNMESFYSMRMNDCHDCFNGGQNLWPPLKTKRPDLLFSTSSRKPPYGYWSGVDYGKKDIRDLACKIIEEAVDKFPLDGIELDFCRHWCFFKSAAFGDKVSREEINGMTDMIRRMRKACDIAGKKRNRPILLVVRVLDSVEACLAQGLDLETWCREGLIDIAACGSEIRLNQVDFLTGMAKKYPNVKFYAVQTEAQMSGQHPLLKRNNSPLNFRGQAAAAHHAGAAGIYSFNEYTPGAFHARYLGEIGDEKMLMGLNKFYYFSHSYSNAGSFGRNWHLFQKMPSVTPASPLPLSRKIRKLELCCGKENPGARMMLMLQLRNMDAGNTAVKFNGKVLEKGKMLDGIAVFDVPQDIFKPGYNHAEISAAKSPEPRMLFKGDKLLVHGVNQGAWRRLFGSEGFVSGKSEFISDKAYILCDVTDKAVSNLAHPLETTPDGKLEIAFDAKLGFATAPGASGLRIANGRYTETLWLMENGIKLKNAGFFHPCNIRDRFHNFVLAVEKSIITLKLDGKILFQGKMNVPAANDCEIVEKYSAIKLPWLSNNSIILGSLSPEGRSEAAFRNFTLRNEAVSGYLVDGALLVIHKPEDKDLPVALQPELISKLPVPGEKLVTVLTPENHAPWVKIGGQSNLSISRSGFLLNNQLNGPIIKLPLQAKFKLLEAEFEFTALDEKEKSPQLQALVATDAPNGKSFLWGFRFARNTVRFIDDPATAMPKEKNNSCKAKILVDPESGIAEVYAGDDPIPVLRHRALTVNRIPQTISFGDGSVAVKGRTLLKDARITLHGAIPPESINDKLVMPPAAETLLTPAVMKNWQKTFFNSQNLQVTTGFIKLDHRNGGPTFRYYPEKSDPRFVKAELVFSADDPKCTKGQLQLTVIVDGEAGKSRLWGYRFGKDHFRFLDEAPLPLTPDKDGKVHVLLVIDREGNNAEIFINHSRFPAQKHKALTINRGKASVALGDGSSAIEGECRIYRAEVKFY